MKLRGFDITKCQRGWECDCFFTVRTASVFTDEEMVVRFGSRWFLHAMLGSYFAAKAAASKLRAKPGERAIHGWSD